MISPEKNDVDISRLFSWSRQATIYHLDGIKEEIVYIRLVGDSDWNIARVKALRASAELRRRLNDLESDERLAYIPDKELLEKEGLITMTIMLDMPNMRDQILEELRVPEPREPDSKSTLEDHEKYQEALDNYEKERQDAIRKKVEDLVEIERKKLTKKSFDAIFDEYVKLQINSLCTEELNRTFEEYCTYLGTYSDENFTKKYFNSFDEFVNLPTPIKQQFIKNYNALEIGVYDLKK